ncbi:YihY family protein [Aeromicrobium marinum DSM 15272]|uniref:YihY family protein n=1 Tax=Aeromicrobium marinum DSM 15272 TaxID=585531 RepID=E2S918_9ACTN|nr:YihY/virulence factor BrkB family protein [Aeromicrobium marinum]EFQ84288.1 YihY family protein [Aeromicrobium marinum DSM 15272]
MGELRSILTTAWKQASSRQASLLAAGVAFYAFLSLFPAMIAGILTYGLVVSPETLTRHTQAVGDALPADAASLITGQMESLADSSGGSLGFGLALAVVLALYSASGGVGNLVTAVNEMFGFPETRSFIKRKLLSLGLTAGALLFFVVTITLVAVAPAVLDALIDVPGLRIALEAGRWAMLLGALVVGVGVLFRLAPDRTDEQATPLVNRGVVVAAALWLVVSLGFSLYVDNFGSYGETYGALAGVVILLLWLWAGLFAMLLGASIESVREEAVLESEDDLSDPGVPPAAAGAHRSDGTDDPAVERARASST